MPTKWKSLEELREVALAAGYTRAQFHEALEAAGDDPADVANYLKLHAMQWKLPRANATRH